ncbi:MAG TPA: NAD(P)/FAD-dependent oxidoreductase [Anaerolineales bacterium]|nr:NAD(P)/FAD-dependent oxidoreductase [Anaerolineales bacterium]
MSVLVIGAGAAGLAVGACLKRANVPCIIVEQNDTVGSVWRRHYDRLHLHTDKSNSELPFAHFPRDYPRYISRDQLVDYLERYAKQFQLDIRFNQEVKSARRDKGTWTIITQNSAYQADRLVIASGYSRRPNRPTWRGLETFPGRVLHSSEYKIGSTFKGQKVLVVGFGNSGGEIAIDLHEQGARPDLSVRQAVNVIPRELAGIPILSIGIAQRRIPSRLADAINAPILRAAVGDIKKYGLQKLPYGPITQIRKDRRIPLIDIGTMKLIRNGNIVVRRGVREVARSKVRFDDDTEANYDALILATGYRPHVNEFLQQAEGALDAEGTPAVTGKESPISGLYFCGFFVSPTGMLREIALEAKRVSAAIAEQK